ncbi:MAG: hypothetical protein DMD78_04475 [Candidatus Rokuibacteriota bacterium]|nr:MAG: hypothetical protein DMD78_04475 [Candidatus Rokubacteria bacterium]
MSWPSDPTTCSRRVKTTRTGSPCCGPSPSPSSFAASRPIDRGAGRETTTRVHVPAGAIPKDGPSAVPEPRRRPDGPTTIT